MDTKIVQAFQVGKAEEAIELATSNNFSIYVLIHLADICDFEHLWAIFQVAVDKEMDLKEFVFIHIVSEGRVDLVNFLFGQKGLDPNTPYGTFRQTILMKACSYNRLDIVEKLLALDTIDVQQQDSHGQTVFSYLDPSTDVNIFHSLFIRIRDIDCLNPSGRSILYRFCGSRGKGKDLFNAILDLNVVDINGQDFVGRTALHIGVETFLNGNMETRDRLLALINHPNIDFAIQDCLGRTVEDLCVKKDNPNAQFILDAIAAVQQK